MDYRVQYYSTKAVQNYSSQADYENSSTADGAWRAPKKRILLRSRRARIARAAWLRAGAQIIAEVVPAWIDDVSFCYTEDAPAAMRISRISTERLFVRSVARTRGSTSIHASPRIAVRLT
ncbi:MAG: hypothetical protein IVW56_04915 [Candidatus Binataceae bacterium]|nr:hypothetical protein [Candidatus Binataceae bacterium]